jgi:penicillin-binding protein 1A
VIDRVQNRQGETMDRHDDRPCPVCEEAEWSGQPAPNPPDDREQISDPQATFQLVNMMEGVVQRGTAARLRALGIPLAGKTGTTSDYHDAWFVGFTPDLAVGVFVGFDNPRSLGSREAGSAVAAPIFGSFMAEALDGIEVPPFRIPPGLRLVRVDPATGLPADPGDNFIWEAYRPGTEPNAQRLEELPPTSFGESLPGAIQGTGGLY